MSQGFSRSAAPNGLAMGDGATIMRAMMTIRFLARLGLAAAAGLVGFATAALGQSVERLGDFEDWSAFRFSEQGGKACYIASQPVKAEGNYTRRGEIYALVTHRPAENRRDEISIIIGYTFKQDSFVDVAIGSNAFRMFTKDDGAWTANSDKDKELVTAMKAGARMQVKGTSSRGTLTTDTYSLKGFTAAYNKISEICAPQ